AAEIHLSLCLGAGQRRAAPGQQRRAGGSDPPLAPAVAQSQAYAGEAGHLREELGVDERATPDDDRSAVERRWTRRHDRQALGLAVALAHPLHAQRVVAREETVLLGETVPREPVARGDDASAGVDDLQRGQGVALADGLGEDQQLLGLRPLVRKLVRDLRDLYLGALELSVHLAQRGRERVPEPRVAGLLEAAREQCRDRGGEKQQGGHRDEHERGEQAAAQATRHGSTQASSSMRRPARSTTAPCTPGRVRYETGTEAS